MKKKTTLIKNAKIVFGNSKLKFNVNLKASEIGFKKNTNLANQRELIFDIFIAIGLSKKINAVETSSMSLLKNNLNLKKYNVLLLDKY